ncbi:MAG TPA: tocopherol cyclase family protein [Labilithrix sp.]|nr:tocopherol cyclase family protein [Labilithrix sp.]
MSVSQDLLDLRYRGGGHVESWFLKATEPGGRRAVWLKNTVFAQRGMPPLAEAWAVVFDRARGHVAVKTQVPLERARFARGTLDVEVDGCELSLGRARGTLATGTRRVDWDLAVGPERASPIVHLPRHALYESRFPANKLVTPLADSRIAGVVRVDRGEGAPPEEWPIEQWPAMIGHSWGPSHARLYAWVHCNTWDDAEDLTFEAVSARVRMGPVLSPMATGVFVRWKGRAWDLNARELFGNNRGLISLRRWEVSAEGRGLEVRAELSGETDDFVGLHYPNPSGAMTYCLNTKLARARLELRLPGAAPLVATSRAGALEIGTRDREHGVRMYL